MVYFLGTIIYTVLILALVFLGPALSAIAIRYSLSIPWQLFLLGICIFYGVLPLLLGWVGTHLAQRFGCQAEINTYVCPANPGLGDLITAMVFIGNWGSIITIPSGGLGVIGFIISFALKLFR